MDNGVVTKHYLAGATRIAMRKNGTLYYMLSDHLGSTSITLNSSGSKIAELRYRAWGETRYTSGTTYTAYQFTAQRNETALGLYFYNARWYDPYLNRFTQPDSIVPLASQGTQAWDRYAYANNSPVRYNDPTGHLIDDGCDTEGCEGEDQTLPPPGVSQERHKRLRAIQEEAELLSLLMQSGAISDVEALARLLDFAAILYSDEVNGALTDLGVVVGGLDGTHIIDENDPNEPMGQYYVGYAAFDPAEGTTGFQSIYNPSDDNQVRHWLMLRKSEQRRGSR